MATLDLDAVTGLSKQEAEEKLAAEGYNELPESKKRSTLGIVFEVIHEPMFILLVASGLVYFVLGDFSEGAMLLSFVVLIIAITVYQEQKTERALDALRNLASPRALVIRDGEHTRIPGREVVMGDMLIVVEGDRVPADGILLSANNVSVDESRTDRIGADGACEVLTIVVPVFRRVRPYGSSAVRRYWNRRTGEPSNRRTVS